MGNVTKFPYKLSNTYKTSGYYKLYDAVFTENGKSYSCFLMEKKTNPPAALELARAHVNVLLIVIYIYIVLAIETFS
jgi:hypothetical protein